MTAEVKYNVKWSIFIPVVLIILLVGWGMVYFLNEHVVKQELTLHEPVYLLLIGVDINPGGDGKNHPEEMTRTDTLMLAILNTYRSKISLVSIPRDTVVNIPDVGEDKINSASVYGGYDLTRKMVGELLGVNIDHYAIVNFETFKELVDLVGGVEVNVPKRMRYADEYGVDKIKLDPGLQKLNGDKALQFVRFRNDELGDIGRVERQRAFMMALFKKLKRPENITKIPQLMEISRKYVKTDMGKRYMLKLINFGRTVNSSTGFTSETLPGEFYGPNWKPHPDEIAQLMERLKPVPTPVPSKR